MYASRLKFIIIAFSLTACWCIQGVVVIENHESYSRVGNFELCSNRNMTLFFKSYQLSGLLLYTEDLRWNRFLSIKLVDNLLVKIEFKLVYQDVEPRTVLIDLTRDPFNSWNHITLSIQSHEANSDLSIVFNRKLIKKINLKFGIECRNRINQVFLGGLPGEMKLDATERVLFAAAIETGYIGLLDLTLSEIPNGKEINLRMNGTRETMHFRGSESYACSSMEKSEIQINERNWIEYKPIQKINTNMDRLYEEKVSLYFRTYKSESFLYEIVYEDLSAIQYHIQNGIIEIYQIVSGEIVSIRKSDCRSSYHTCSDGQWHSVVTKTRLDWIETEIDLDKKSEIKRRQENAKSRVKNIKAGSFPHYSIITDPSRFIGCISKFEYSNPELTENILNHLTPDETNNFTVGSCEIENTRKLSNKTANFIKPGGYIRSNLGWKTISKGMIEIAFSISNREKYRNTLLLFMSAIPESEFPSENLSLNNRVRSKDFFAIEIREGLIYCTWNFGSGVGILLNNLTNVADQRSHKVQVLLNGEAIHLLVDDTEPVIYKRLPDEYKYLNLNGKLYIGGVPIWLTNVKENLPRDVFSLFQTPQSSFYGCIQSVRIDKTEIDLQFEMIPLKTHTVMSIDSCSQAYESVCNSNLCQGTCVSNNKCDCFDTNRFGENCEHEYPIVYFNGLNYIYLLTSQTLVQSVFEDIDIRFKPESGSLNTTLLKMYNLFYESNDTFEITFVDKIINLFYWIKSEKRLFQVKDPIVMGKWNNLKITRKYGKVFVFFSNKISQFDLDLTDPKLQYDQIAIGSFYKSGKVISPEKTLKTSQDNVYENFIGMISRFIFNGISMTHSLRGEYNNSENQFFRVERKLRTNIPTDTFQGSYNESKFPISFRRFNSYIKFNQYLPSDNKRIVLEMKVDINNNNGQLICFSFPTCNSYVYGEVDSDQIIFTSIQNSTLTHFSTLSKMSSRQKTKYIEMTIRDETLFINDSIFSIHCSSFMDFELVFGNFGNLFKNLDRFTKKNSSFIGSITSFKIDNTPINLFRSLDESNEIYLDNTSNEVLDHSSNYVKDSFIIDCKEKSFGTFFSCSRELLGDCNCFQTIKGFRLEKKDEIGIEFTRSQSMIIEDIQLLVQISDESSGELLVLKTTKEEIIEVVIERNQTMQILAMNNKSKNKKLFSTKRLLHNVPHIVQIILKHHTIGFSVDKEASNEIKVNRDNESIKEIRIGSLGFKGSVFGFMYNELNIIKVLSGENPIVHINSILNGAKLVENVKLNLDRFLERDIRSDVNNNPVSDMASFNNDKPDEVDDNRIIYAKEDCSYLNNKALLHCNPNSKAIIQPTYDFSPDKSPDSKIEEPLSMSSDESLRDKTINGPTEFIANGGYVNTYVRMFISNMNWLIVAICAGAVLTITLLLFGIFKCQRKKPNIYQTAPLPCRSSIIDEEENFLTSTLNYPNSLNSNSFSLQRSNDVDSYSQSPVPISLLNISKSNSQVMPQFLLLTDQGSSTLDNCTYEGNEIIKQPTSNHPMQIVLTPNSNSMNSSIMFNKNQEWFK